MDNHSINSWNFDAYHQTLEEVPGLEKKLERTANIF